MKLIFSISTILLATTSLLGCEKTPSNGSPTTPPASASSATAGMTTSAKPNSGKTYAAGVHTSYAPFSYLDENGKPIGFDIDILNAIADDQKLNFDLIPGNHTSDYAQVLSGKEQMAAAGITYNDERVKIYAAPEPYRTTKNVLVYNRPDLNAKELKDLAGLRVGVIGLGSSHEKHVNDAKVPIKEISRYNTPYLALQALLLDKIDVAVLNGDVVLPLFKTMPNQKFVSNPYAVNGKVAQDLIFVINKNETELLNKVNAGLKNIKANGSYDRISEKWFGSEASNTPPTSAPASTTPATK